MFKITLAVLLLSPLLESQVGQAPQDYSREVPYTGRELSGQVYLCRSDRVVRGGYRLDAASGSVVEVADAAK